MGRDGLKCEARDDGGDTAVGGKLGKRAAGKFKLSAAQAAE